MDTVRSSRKQDVSNLIAFGIAGDHKDISRAGLGSSGQHGLGAAHPTAMTPWEATMSGRFRSTTQSMFKRTKDFVTSEEVKNIAKDTGIALAEALWAVILDGKTVGTPRRTGPGPAKAA